MSDAVGVPFAAAAPHVVAWRVGAKWTAKYHLERHDGGFTYCGRPLPKDPAAVRRAQSVTLEELCAECRESYSRHH